ncbi:hypothetical protein, partial [Desulfofundulus thermosubterraneus]|uniref:hypothetical protein n=1 Tax=Desulfofundulus thermosubterraneus TaxID=348840 RepID=UPI001A96B1D3
EDSISSRGFLCPGVVPFLITVVGNFLIDTTSCYFSAGKNTFTGRVYFPEKNTPSRGYSGRWNISHSTR